MAKDNIIQCKVAQYSWQTLCYDEILNTIEMFKYDKVWLHTKLMGVHFVNHHETECHIIIITLVLNFAHLLGSFMTESGVMIVFPHL